MADDDGKVVAFPEAWRRPGFVLSEHHVADAFAPEHRHEFAYSPARKMWRRYDGVRWLDDLGSLALHRAMNTLLEEIEEVVRKPRDRQRIGANSFRGGIERELRALMQVDEEAFDANPWLLNCPSGTLDLHIGGNLRPHAASDFITKVTAADPDGPCGDWLSFIEWLCVGDVALADYLQRLLGYAMAGVADEQMLAFLYGTGANGKTVFLQTALHVLGGYGVSVPSEVFTLSQFERHPEELMRMRGARLIVASEVADNAAWNEARLKQVTGGERVMARYMRENTVEFDSTGTLVIAGNNPPGLRGVDEAIKRRFHIIPCRAKVRDEDRDKHLTEHLRCEAAGILAWIVAGCRRWQSDGLARPEAIRLATDEYIADENAVEQWIAECCTHDRAAAFEIRQSPLSEKSGTLYASWKKWADDAGVTAGPKNRFTRRLVNAGFHKYVSGPERRVRGIALRVEPRAPDLYDER